MFYREVGQFKTNYSSDSQVFPILQDKIGIFAMLVVAFVFVPMFGSEFFLNSIMIPFLIFTLATIGLNILVGYTGQLSLGTGAFMGVGAYSCYKLATIFPDVNIIIMVLLSGFFSAGVGILFGNAQNEVSSNGCGCSSHSQTCAQYGNLNFPGLSTQQLDSIQLESGAIYPNARAL